jgi:hypothetical protein
MFGIALLWKPTENLLKKTIIKRAPNFVNAVQLWFIKALTMQVCVTVATVPFVVMYFGGVPVFGVLVNLLFLPLMILAFQVAFIAVITWVGKFLLYPINHLVDFVKAGTTWLAEIPWARIPITQSGYWFLAYFVALILCSRFVLLRPAYKYSVAAIFFGIYTLGFFF